MQIAICDDEKSIGLILEEKIKKLLPDAVIEKYLSGDELIASGCEQIFYFRYSDARNGSGMKQQRILSSKRNERMVLIFVTAVESMFFRHFDVAAFHYW